MKWKKKGAEHAIVSALSFAKFYIYCRALDAFSLSSTFSLTARTHSPDDCTI